MKSAKNWTRQTMWLDRMQAHDVLAGHQHVYSLSEWARAELARCGTPIGPNDLMIAAIALAHDLTLVTHNTTEFSRVSGLRVEDWE